MIVLDSKKSEYKRRFLERSDKRDFIKYSDDFKPRKENSPTKRLALYLSMIMIISLGILMNFINSMLYLPQVVPPPEDQIFKALGIVIFSFILACLVAAVIVEQVRKNVLSAEFQSMVFASGMKVDNDFCLIVHREKAGFYCDYSFSELFSDYGKQNHDPFHQLLASEGFKASDEELLLEILERGESASFTFVLNRKGKKSKKMTVLVDPLKRPKDFFIIRGKYA